MRPLKFRVWNTTSKKMYFPKTWDLYENMFDGSGRFEVMQFTGLTDAFNTPIYEGDVMASDLHRTELVWVYWDESQARFALDDNVGSGEMSLNYNGWVVIGNIYENPDLPEVEAHTTNG